jgi:hypothetical protein
MLHASESVGCGLASLPQEGLRLSKPMAVERQKRIKPPGAPDAGGAVLMLKESVQISTVQDGVAVPPEVRGNRKPA